jgi:hypothetical protein
VGERSVHLVKHGAGRPVLVLHGAGVHHREPEACFEPAVPGWAGSGGSVPTCPEWAGLLKALVAERLARVERMV